MKIWDYQKSAMPLKIEDGAVFISDAHENENRRFFWDFLCQIKSGKIKPSQLFLMGDMFDLLVGEIESTHDFAQKYIQLLEDLALRFPIYYFEGNHDFNLSVFFSHVKVFPFEKQPVSFKSEAGNVLLSHGDCGEKFSYKIYTKTIRNKLTCKLLNSLNRALNNKISNKILSNQNTKDICTKIENFEEKISLKYAKTNLKSFASIAEGHYHQTKRFAFDEIMYINFSSFACDKRYFIGNFFPHISFTEVKFKV